SGLPHLSCGGRVEKQPRRFLREVSSVPYLERGASNGGLLDCFQDIVNVRPNKNRFTHSARFDQVLTSVRNEASADESDVTGLVIGIHLAEAVAEQDLGIGPNCRILAAALKVELSLGNQFRDLAKSVRMTGND